MSDTRVELPQGLAVQEARKLRSGDRVLLRWRGEGQGLPRNLDGAWGSVMSVNRDHVTVEIGSARGSDLHCVALAAIARVEQASDGKERRMNEERLAPNAPEGPIAPPGKVEERDPSDPDPARAGTPAPQEPARPTPGSAESGGLDEPPDAITES